MTKHPIEVIVTVERRGRWSWLLDLFGGRQSARTLHFIFATSLVAFVLVHIVMVIASGVLNNMRSMITGRYAISTEPSSASSLTASEIAP